MSRCSLNMCIQDAFSAPREVKHAWISTPNNHNALCKFAPDKREVVGSTPTRPIPLNHFPITTYDARFKRRYRRIRVKFSDCEQIVTGFSRRFSAPRAFSCISVDIIPYQKRTSRSSHRWRFLRRVCPNCDRFFYCPGVFPMTECRA